MVSVNFLKLNDMFYYPISTLPYTGTIKRLYTRIIIQVSGLATGNAHSFTLTISKVQPKHFGNYTLYLENEVGSATKYMQLRDYGEFMKRNLCSLDVIGEFIRWGLYSRDVTMASP